MSDERYDTWAEVVLTGYVLARLKGSRRVLVTQPIPGMEHGAVEALSADDQLDMVRLVVALDIDEAKSEYGRLYPDRSAGRQVPMLWGEEA
jgi:predicted flavoprotein YhiN